MNSDDVWVPQAQIQCAVCAIEVPLDEAVVPEVADRLTYLCGFDCYARWRATAAIFFPVLSPDSDRCGGANAAVTDGVKTNS